MANTHKVLTQPTKLGDKDNPKAKGKLTVWAFDVEGIGASVLYKKEGNDPPQVGDALDVEDHWDVEENGQSRQRLKLAYNQQQKAPQNGSQGSSDDFSRRPDHPDNVARMRHTTALSAAPRYIEQMLTIGVVDQPTSKQQYVELVTNVVLWLESTYLPPAPVPESDVPADGTFEQPPVGDTADIPFS